MRIEGGMASTNGFGDTRGNATRPWRPRDRCRIGRFAGGASSSGRRSVARRPLRGELGSAVGAWLGAPPGAKPEGGPGIGGTASRPPMVRADRRVRRHCSVGAKWEAVLGKTLFLASGGRKSRAAGPPERGQSWRQRHRPRRGPGLGSGRSPEWASGSGPEERPEWSPGSGPSRGRVVARILFLFGQRTLGPEMEGSE